MEKGAKQNVTKADQNVLDGIKPILQPTMLENFTLPNLTINLNNTLYEVRWC